MIGTAWDVRRGRGTRTGVEVVAGGVGLHVRDHWSDRVSVSLIPIAANSFVRYLVKKWLSKRWRTL